MWYMRGLRVAQAWPSYIIHPPIDYEQPTRFYPTEAHSTCPYLELCDNLDALTDLHPSFPMSLRTSFMGNGTDVVFQSSRAKVPHGSSSI